MNYVLHNLYNLKTISFLYTLLCCESGEEVCDNLLQLGIRIRCDLTLLGDSVKETLVAGLNVLGEFLFKGSDLGGVQFVEMSTHTAVDDGDLVNTQFIILYLVCL